MQKSPFNRWRPTFHVLAPRMWMNDPCGAAFIPETEEYLVTYQWFTGGTKWGNNAWGQARSKDLIRWTDCEPAITLGPPGSSDSLGVFSGSVTSKLSPRGKRMLYLFYTSVSHLPIHWSIPYFVGCESQSVAVSCDHGISWQKRKLNPLPLQAPLGNKVIPLNCHLPPLSSYSPKQTTGWRDPFVGTWPSLSQLLSHGSANRSRSSSTPSKSAGSPAQSDTSSPSIEIDFPNPTEEAYFMIISSGERNEGPQLQLYTSSDPGLDNWQELGVLLSVKKQTKWNDFLPDFGVNFECGSFCSIKASDGTVRDYVIVGVEGGDPDRGRWVLWMEGCLVLDDKLHAKFEIQNCGRLDHGIFYSACTFRGPPKGDSDGELIAWGWANEDDSDRDRSDQGWAGSLTLPRELFVLTAKIPPGRSGVPVGWISCNGLHRTMSTLGIRPAGQVEGLRQNANLFENEDLEFVRSRCFEISSSFLLRDNIQRLGFKVRMSEDARENTTIVIDIKNSEIRVDRERSSLLPFANKLPSRGHFELLRNRLTPTSRNGPCSPFEALDVRIFVDNSLIEVFINERFAMTTRVYPSLSDSLRVQFFSESSPNTPDAGLISRDIKAWTDLVRAWDSRKQEKLFNVNP
ncbi:MAG: hypothetical protein M1839_007695 [Geoglossum umbratile]|nr:MAG: hypothetical protein M1839_007695 [Geoglossum umbratile]